MWMRMMMQRLAATARAMAGTVSRAYVRSGRRRTDLAMLEWNERLLRDVGLTRADFVECLSSPWDNTELFRRLHPASYLHPVARPARETEKLAA